MEEQTPFLERPVVRALIGFGVFIIVYYVMGFLMNFFFPPSDPLSNLITQLSDFALCLVGLVFWMAFFSQFAMPVRTLGERKNILTRLIFYLIGMHGPAIFIANGVVQEREGESKKRGRGLIWLDVASAAMLRTAVKFTRTIGPGLHFTNKSEYIAATADLHTMIQKVGPLDSEQPFTIKKDDENYESAQARRWETSAMTRDGIEVVATIAVIFRINASEGEGNSPFGFNEENTRRAITGSLTQGVQVTDPIWSQLPSKMAADIWREYLRKFKLSQLFETTPGTNQTTLQIISSMIKDRLTKEMVDEVDDFGQPTGNQVPSMEYKKLEELGYKVFNGSVKRVMFAPDIEERLINQWTNLWLKNAQKEREQVDVNRKHSETTGREEALKNFAEDASDELSKIRPDNKIHALEMLIHSTFLGVRRNSALLRRTTTEQGDLSKIRDWLRQKRGVSTDNG